MKEIRGTFPCLIFLGIDLNMMQQLSRLLAAKVAELEGHLISLRDKHKASLLELQKLIYLSFDCRVLTPTLTFLRHLYNTMAGLHQQH